MSTPNWSKLVDQNRAHSLGRGWTDDELKAIYELKIPAEYVRGGVLTFEAYKQVISQEEDAKSPCYMKKDELVVLARKEGLQFDETAITRADLILFLERKSSASTPLQGGNLKQEELAGA